MKNVSHTLYSRWPDRSCCLFFGCRTKADVFHLQEFRELAARHADFHVVCALSDPVAPEELWGGESGFIHLSVGKHLDANAKRQAFVCGPGPMIGRVTQLLEEKALRAEDIFYDEF